MHADRIFRRGFRRRRGGRFPARRAVVETTRKLSEDDTPSDSGARWIEEDSGA